MNGRAESGLAAEVLGCLGVLALWPFAFAWSAALNGYMIATLWGWFVVPAFGLPPLSRGLAAGLAVLIGYVNFRYIDDEREKDKRSTLAKVTDRALQHLALASFVLAEGYILHRWWLS